MPPKSHYKSEHATRKRILWWVRRHDIFLQSPVIPISVRYKYSHQNSLLKYPQSKFVPSSERSNFTSVSTYKARRRTIIFVPYTTSAFDDEQRLMLKIIHDFGRHFNCHVQGEYVNVGRFWKQSYWIWGCWFVDWKGGLISNLKCASIRGENGAIFLRSTC